jgi:hypothetical protein
MPLSEQEQRLLEEMERSLYRSDADVVATVGGPRGKPNYRMVVIGILIAILGVATIVTGIVIHQPIVGVLGFGIMFVGVLLAITPSRRVAPDRSPSATGPTVPHVHASLMDRLNDRWDKRQDEHGQ